MRYFICKSVVSSRVYHSILKGYKVLKPNIINSQQNFEDKAKLGEKMKVEDFQLNTINPLV